MAACGDKYKDVKEKIHKLCKRSEPLAIKLYCFY